MSREETVYACEDLDLVFSAKQVEEFRTWYNDGYDILQIARAMKRRPEEVAILTIDQGYRRKINHSVKSSRKSRTVSTTVDGKGINSRTVSPVDAGELYRLYYNENKTLEDIGIHFGLSRDRITQIIVKERRREPERWPLRAREGVKRDGNSSNKAAGRIQGDQLAPGLSG